MMHKFKSLTGAALCALSMAYMAPAMANMSPVTAEAPDKNLFDMFSNIFGGDENAKPIDPAQLNLAEQAVGKILPDGVLTKIMGDMFDKILGPIANMLPEMSSGEIMTRTGIYDGAVENLDAEKRSQITEILDPARKQRGQKMVETMVPLMTEAMGALEGPMRTGLSRAYARKFSAEQLGEINAFFATPTGSFYASESYALQADPEVMNATFKAMPMLLQKVMASGPDIEAELKKIAEERKLTDLSRKEMKQLAGLLDVSLEKLKEARKFMSELEVDEEAAKAVSDDPAASE